MTKNKYSLVLLVFVLISNSAFSNYDTTVFNPLLKKMRFHSDTLRNSLNQQKRYDANDSFLVLLKEFINTEGSFQVNPDSINSVMFKRSPDKKIRVITWLIADNSGNYKSYGVIQQMKRKDEVIAIWLKEKLNTDIKEIENTDYNEGEWPGGLIYHIQEFKYKKKTRYLILTFHGMGTQTNRKTIDVMSLEDDGVVFGLPIFMRYKNDPDPNYRVVFTFSDQATMVLRYDTKVNLIVFDHLVPAAGMVRGVDEFLIPDGTYGAYAPTRKGKWERIEDFGKYKKWKEE